MHKINKITFNNFKFFHTPETEINLNEKNLLLYGENGSGKSSIYWGLYTFAQSVFKEVDQVQKYFDPSGDQRLINIYDDTNSKISIELTENGNNLIDNTISYKAEDIIATKAELKFKEATISSDFINYKLLFNHYNFLNTEDIDLFNLFLRDILPITTFGTNLKSISGKEFNHSIDVWNDINTEFESEQLPNNYLENRAEYTEIKYPPILELSDKFNDKFEEYLNSLIEDINQIFIQKYFKLDLSLKFEYIKSTLIEGEFITQDEKNKFYVSYRVSAPKINLRIIDNTIGITIPNPHTFLNEAKLSAIALSIRFATIKEKAISDAPKILVLDDFLLSLDMGNRQYVFDIIFNEFKDFQILFMTHDRGLYHYMQQHIRNRSIQKDWIFKEMYQSNKTGKNVPEIIDIQKNSPIEKAEYHLKKHDYPACGIYLRRECEDLLDKLLPDKEKYKINNDIYTNTENTQSYNLNDKLKHLKIFCQKEKILFEPFEDLIVYKSVILNALAHNDFTSPLYKRELEIVIKTLYKLSKIERVKSQNIKSGKSIDIQLIKKDETTYKIGLKAKERFWLIKEHEATPRLSYYSKVIVTGIVDNGIPTNINIEKESIYDVLFEHCKILDIEIPNIIDVIYSRDKKKIIID